MQSEQRQVDGPERPTRSRVLRFTGETGRVFDLIATLHADGEVRLAIVAVPSPRLDPLEAAR